MNKQSPFTESKLKRSPPLKVKEWAIKRLKQGNSPAKISKDVKELFGVYVSLMSIYRWKRRYAEVTKEPIPAWHEINQTPEQKKQNMYQKPQESKEPKQTNKEKNQ